jgi:ketosteroid isomerase-like protein
MKNVNRLLLVGIVMIMAVPAARAAGSARDIANLELQFAETVEERGIKAGFLAYLADDAVVFEPEARAARPVYEAAIESGAKLRWRPSLAAIAKSGDLGYASGPWAFSKSVDEAPIAFGHYITVWKKLPSGEWRVLLDGGADEEVAPADRTNFLAPKLRLHKPAGGRGTKNCSTQFFDTWKSSGRAQAITRFADKDVRLLHAGVTAFEGRDLALKQDALNGRVLGAWRVGNEVRSSGGDVGVVFGTIDFSLAGGAAQRATVIQVWDTGGGCRLVIDVTHPLPAAPQ